MISKESSKIIRLILMIIGVSMVFFVAAIVILSTFGNNSNKTSDSTISCGGIAGIKCPVGSLCVYPQPNYPDQMGKCEPSPVPYGAINRLSELIETTYTNIVIGFKTLWWNLFGSKREIDPNFGVPVNSNLR